MPAAVLLLLLPIAGAQPEGNRHPLTGRRIAGVMGLGGADWLERSEREAEEAPSKAIELLGLKPGMVVADVGAGTGYFTLRMATRVAPGGMVYANDIQPGMLARLRRNLKREKIENVAPVLGSEHDPNLPEGSLDLALLVDVYHEFSQPAAMLRGIHRSLKPGGMLVLLEYRKEDPGVPIRAEHKMSVAEVTAELEAGGFRLDRVLNGLPRQHLLIFRKDSGGLSSTPASPAR